VEKLNKGPKGEGGGRGFPSEGGKPGYARSQKKKLKKKSGKSKRVQQGGGRKEIPFQSPRIQIGGPGGAASTGEYWSTGDREKKIGQRKKLKKTVVSAGRGSFRKQYKRVDSRELLRSRKKSGGGGQDPSKSCRGLHPGKAKGEKWESLLG